ncbi:DJ-1/PfpI family protein [Pseudoalteromonas luteoviolacea]|uniref:type 1 glutamine amidotransferase domain-containing protein n=1 Tax=Pseudoalteromonas luteoviolacea TaxID=43657 RepID=UPI001B39E9B5|nr:type 1 glutamine amidotransferase domain-containing protein [Pseudoalteromonas luteoviolacea]MBQ4879604.1 DJ-1/PfpI family protein [Pseudoalteromonas luteoviolacea]MBQ4908737.1 DJ-1/PfpI family protein [Pseudoalteromonas luteoviolacea]
MKNFVLFAGISLCSSIAFADEQRQVLMVLSSYGAVDENQTLIKPGFEFGELTKAYYVFKRHGIEVTLASPLGGKPVADSYDKSAPYNERFLKDEAALSSLANTYKLDEINANQFDGVFVVGGKGPMFDLHQHKPLKKVIAKIYEGEGVVGAVCHGPAALVDVQLNDGQYLVSGKRVNGFTNAEESAFGSKWLKDFPFLLQDKLVERGGIFEQDSVMLNQVTVDGRVITGQNPFSTVDTARAMVSALDVKLLPEQYYRDDATVKLYELFLNDRQLAIDKLQKEPQIYDFKMLAMISVVQINNATSEFQVSASVALLEYILPQFIHPIIIMTLAKAYVRLNQFENASKVLDLGIKKFPDNQKIKSFIASF